MIEVADRNIIVRERQLRVVVNKKKHALLGSVEVQEDGRVNVVEKERKKKGWSGRKEEKGKKLEARERR